MLLLNLEDAAQIGAELVRNLLTLVNKEYHYFVARVESFLDFDTQSVKESMIIVLLVSKALVTSVFLLQSFIDLLADIAKFSRYQLPNSML